jgi:hypothetical protein
MKQKIVPIIALSVVGMLFTKQSGAQRSVSQEPSRACTMEAKVCPDGSSVGRVGPNCEFAPCPSGTPKGREGWDLQNGAPNAPTPTAPGCPDKAKSGSGKRRARSPQSLVLTPTTPKISDRIESIVF